MDPRSDGTSSQTPPNAFSLSHLTLDHHLGTFLKHKLFLQDWPVYAFFPFDGRNEPRMVTAGSEDVDITNAYRPSGIQLGQYHV